mgnify:CR=1 FL=1
MQQNLEIEFKMLVSRDQFETLKQRCQPLQLTVQTNVYYDCTPSAARRRIAMRIRDVEGRHWFTCKVPSDNGVMEYELPLQENSAQALRIPPVQSLFDQLGLTLPVHETGRMTTWRYHRRYPLGELCLDYSLINGHDDYEIEFEVSGDPQQGKAFFMALLRQAGIFYQENRRSKYARCVLERTE